MSSVQYIVTFEPADFVNAPNPNAVTLAREVNEAAFDVKPLVRDLSGLFQFVWELEPTSEDKILGGLVVLAHTGGVLSSATLEAIENTAVLSDTQNSEETGVTLVSGLLTSGEWAVMYSASGRLTGTGAAGNSEICRIKTYITRNGGESNAGPISLIDSKRMKSCTMTRVVRVGAGRTLSARMTVTKLGTGILDAEIDTMRIVFVRLRDLS